MSTQADILSDLTNNDKILVFQELDINLNSLILYALLHGIYTGIVAVTLWNICITASLGTIVTDLYMIWCWIVWGQCWIIVLFPILFLIAATVAAIAKGVAPTLLIGWAAAGHTHPNDDDNSEHTTVSSLHFQTASSEVDTTSYQESTIESTVQDIDIEAQQEQDELIEVVGRTE
ncbi:hypothetical protein F5146DRAFT_999671 [Armillaria mellea]|nr:hypothetical protein F5146DRAFT_999671 [Armillaria mellea]